MVFEKSLTAMVKGIRSNRGKESEYINACLQEIRQEVTSKNLNTKSNAVLKLTYLSMLGYDMSWATFAIVEVMSHNRFAIKRPGYLASSISFNDKTDVSLLTINLFKKDFGAKSQFEAGMALGCLSSICTPEISRDIVNDLSSLLSSSRAYVRKKTVLCLFRIFIKHPPALRTCFPKLKERLGDEDQGVLTATVNTFLELARKNARNYLSLVPQLYHVLVNTNNNWLSIKLLKIFQLLCPLEPRLPAKMVDPLSHLLEHTKAKSVEYEVIRCVVRTMPATTALVGTALEKLQGFLASSDRNLRYLALQLFQELLGQKQFQDRGGNLVPDLHAKVLESVEEQDMTVRKVALGILNRIVVPATFQDTVKKLVDYSKSGTSPDEYLNTVLEMGSRDQYALVEDFAWYLLVLADMAKTQGFTHAGTVASQFVDISVRVPAVRPYAVQLACLLLEGGSTDASAPGQKGKEEQHVLAITPEVMGACAWIIGEFHADFDKPAERAYVGAVKALLSTKHLLSIAAAIQSQCVWAAAKLYLGAATHAAGALPELVEVLKTELPTFIHSTHVEVSERATLAFYLTSFFKVDTATLSNAANTILKEQLNPVEAGAQQKVPVPAGLDLDTPFFPEEKVEKPKGNDRSLFAQAKSADPYQLAASYTEDLGFMTQQDNPFGGGVSTSAPSQKGQSMFYLGASKGPAQGAPAAGQPGAADASVAAPAAPMDPLAEMRAKLEAQKAPVKYEINRSTVTAPGGGAAPAAAPPAPKPQPTANMLPLPTDKEVTELQGRMWSVCYTDDNLSIYMCMKGKSVKKQTLRIDLRCEKKAAESVTLKDIKIKLPDNVQAQEAENGVMTLHAGELTGHSAKVKLTLGLQPFAVPKDSSVQCNLGYDTSRTVQKPNPEASAPAAPAEATPAADLLDLDLDPDAPAKPAPAPPAEAPAAAPAFVSEVVAEQNRKVLAIPLPATTGLAPVAMSEDEVSAYIAAHAQDHLGQQSGQALSFESVADAEALSLKMPQVVGRAAGVCYMFGIQQGGPAVPGKGHKFLLIAAPLANGDMPQGSRIVGLCAAMVKDNVLQMRVTVKSADAEASAHIATHFAATLKEVVEGRLKED